MILTYRYRLLPRKRQHRALEAILESQRQLYNAALEERIGAYRSAGVTRTYFDQTKGLTEWRRDDPDGRAVPACLQRHTLKRLDGAYKAFLRRAQTGGPPGFPRFRGKGRFDSFGLWPFCGITLHDGRLRFRGMPGGLRVHMHSALPAAAPIKSCIFKRDIKGWSISLAVEVPAQPFRSTRRAVGVDLGLRTFATLSDGQTIPSLRAARTAERRLRVAQRSLARKKPASRGRLKARKAVARVHAKIANRRDNFLHEVSCRVIRAFDILAVEAVDLRMLSRSRMAKSLKDAAWSKFISMLRYKAECAGAWLIEVDPQDTTQECSCCGNFVPKGMSASVHKCLVCGLRIDRDLNAARNVLNRAGWGPGLRKVADDGMPAGENIAVPT